MDATGPGPGLSRNPNVAAMEKERLKENLYRAKFSDLLKQQRGLRNVAETYDHPEHFAAETALIKKAVAAERNSWAVGVFVGVAAFASIRYLPKHLVSVIGGEKKAKALQEAEEASRRTKNYLLRSTVGLFLEGSFGFWAGWRGYNMASARSDGTYEEIAKLPLCAGRSAVAEGICPPWTELAFRQVPPPFWQNLDDEEKRLKDERTWRAIRTFAQNCVKRNAYEEALRKERGVLTDATVLVPDPGVPADFMPSSADAEVVPPTRSEANDKLKTAG